MIVLYILLGIILFLLLILLIPFSVHIYYNEEIKIKLKYAFIRYNIDTSKKSIEEETEKDVEKAEQDGEITSTKDKVLKTAKKIAKEKNIKNFLDVVKELTKIIVGGLYKIVKHIKIKELDIYFVASCEDIGKTAMLYAKSCAIIYPFVTIVREKIGGKNIRASVEFDYNKKSNVVIAETEFSIVPIYVVVYAVKMLIKSIPYFKKIKELV